MCSTRGTSRSSRRHPVGTPLSPVSPASSSAAAAPSAPFSPSFGSSWLSLSFGGVSARRAAASSPSMGHLPRHNALGRGQAGGTSPGMGGTLLGPPAPRTCGPKLLGACLGSPCPCPHVTGGKNLRSPELPPSPAKGTPFSPDTPPCPRSPRVVPGRRCPEWSPGSPPASPATAGNGGVPRPAPALPLPPAGLGRPRRAGRCPRGAGGTGGDPCGRDDSPGGAPARGGGGGRGGTIVLGRCFPSRRFVERGRRRGGFRPGPFKGGAGGSGSGGRRDGGAGDAAEGEERWERPGTPRTLWGPPGAAGPVAAALCGSDWAGRGRTPRVATERLSAREKSRQGLAGREGERYGRARCGGLSQVATGLCGHSRARKGPGGLVAICSDRAGSAVSRQDPSVPLPSLVPSLQGAAE